MKVAARSSDKQRLPLKNSDGKADRDAVVVRQQQFKLQLEHRARLALPGLASSILSGHHCTSVPLPPLGRELGITACPSVPDMP
jgi:hypothetical protein